MAKTQLKLLLFLIVLGITLGCMATAYYIYDKILKPEDAIQQEIASIKKVDMPRIDPGAKRFELAVEQIKQGRINEGREALYKMLQQFPDSATCAEAKRIIGEINLDELFSTNQKSGKKDYIVQPRDSLNLIADRQNTNVSMIVRINGLMGATLQPGDHLTIVPLDFSVDVDVSDKTVTLLRNVGDKRYFFKEYTAVDLRLPPGMKAPVEMEIKGKTAVADGKQVISTDPRYVDSEKWLPGSRAGIVLRTVPVKKAVPVPETPAPKAKKSAAPADTPDVLIEEAPETGVFLDRGDLEELFALVRNGSKLHFVR
ncbi:MAG: LysM peptidoglycan-binding domain-containing protein [Verrucomicrobiota bacterium]